MQNPERLIEEPLLFRSQIFLGKLLYRTEPEPVRDNNFPKNLKVFELER